MRSDSESGQGYSSASNTNVIQLDYNDVHHYLQQLRDGQQDYVEHPMLFLDFDNEQ